MRRIQKAAVTWCPPMIQHGPFQTLPLTVSDSTVGVTGND
jgi:hypothetical protein